MTKEQLESIFDRVRSWPPEKQQEAVEVLLWLDGREKNVYELSPEERADIEEGLAELERGEIATEEEVTATFARFRK